VTEKIFYTIDEVCEVTRLPQSLIRHYIRLRKVTVSPNHYPNINPKYVKGELLFTQKDLDELLRFIDKKKGESWQKWELRRIEEVREKRRLAEVKQRKTPDLKLIKGKKKDPPRR
jgi:DNA-binding transcriptional MerR regulator